MREGLSGSMNLETVLRCLRDQGDWSGIATRQGEAMHSAEPWPALIVGHAHLVLDQPDQAIAPLEQAVRLYGPRRDHNAEVARINLAYAYERTGQLNQSVALHHAFLEDAPESPFRWEALFGLGVAVRWQGKAGEAFYYLDRALREANGTEHVLLSTAIRACALADLGDGEPALASLGESLATATGRQDLADLPLLGVALVLGAQAYVLYRLDRHFEAIRTSEESIQRLRSLPPGPYSVGKELELQYQLQALCYGQLGMQEHRERCQEVSRVARRQFVTERFGLA